LLEGLIRRHVEYTGSPLGMRLLANWGEAISNFVKVMPQEYKRILEKRKAAGKSETASSSVNLQREIAVAEVAR
jgi:glutamate synthase domain-containing protein 3